MKLDREYIKDLYISILSHNCTPYTMSIRTDENGQVWNTGGHQDLDPIHNRSKDYISLQHYITQIGVLNE